MAFLLKLRDWLDERLEWDELIAPLREKSVPQHRLSYWYILGGITLFLFVIQVLTGILLLLYYRPGANEAFESVQYIMTSSRKRTRPRFTTPECFPSSQPLRE